MEIEELRAKAIASMPSSSANPNSKPKNNNSLQNRKEGELSSSEEEKLPYDTQKLPDDSSAQTDIASPSITAEPVSVSLRNKNTQNSRMVGVGRSIRNHLPANAAPSSVQASVTVPSKSSVQHMPGRYVPLEANDNLVIKFSDDDSGSDSEECKFEKSQEKQDSSLRTKGHKVPVSLPQIKSAISRRTPKNQIQLMRKKVSATRAFISSMAKITRGHARLPRNSHFEQKFHIQRHGAPCKASASRESGSPLGIDLTGSKMENLRQQIATRENELKLQRKFLPERKEGFPVSNMNSKGALASRPGSVDIEELPSDGQVKKRQKLDMPSQGLLSSDGQPHTLVATSKDPCASSSFPSNTTCLKNLERSVDHAKAVSIDRMSPETCDDLFDKRGVHVSERKLVICDESLHKSSKDQQTLSEERCTAIQSLIKIVEFQDRKFEEAQEIRRRCELEERCALKAYCKAKKALVDANERCSFLFRRRESFSTQLRDFSLEDYSSLLSFRWHALGENGFYSSDQDHPSSSYQHTDSHNLGFDACSGLDATTSGPLLKGNGARDGICAHSNHVNFSAAEDGEALSFDHKTNQPGLACKNMEENLLPERALEIPSKDKRNSVREITQDSSLVEASLRSELFARLGMEPSSKKSCRYGGDHTVGGSADNIDKDEKTHMSKRKLSALSNHSSPEMHRQQSPDMKGTERPGRNISHDPCHGNQFCFDYNDLDESNSSLEESCRPILTSTVSLPSSVLKVVFRHANVILCRSKQESTCRVLDLSADTRQNSIRGGDIGKLDPGICDLAIDPFWPLCMYELRGKCNDEECQWQHIKDYTQRNAVPLNSSTSSDGQHLPLSTFGQLTDSERLGRSLRCYIESIPTYRIGSNLIKADKQSCGYVLARTTCQYWQMGFCSSFAIPLPVQRILPLDVPSLHGRDGHVEDYGSRNRLSLYLQSQDGTMKQLIHGVADIEQSLEMALNIFNQKVNELEGKKKNGFLQPLSMLSRALEATSNSTVLWAVYLHIYYRKEKEIGKDDMFLHAVRHNESSYELWLMFINSRFQLRQRLEAYDSALSALCLWAHAPDENEYVSACILDLFLQMIDFLRMSGNTEKAISRIYQLLPSAMDFDSSQGHISLSDILACLKISDKCILWVCCVYFAIYKKLPEAVVQRFELEQELPFGVDWPFIQLTGDAKHQALELMKTAVDSVALGKHFHENTLGSVHSLAVSHVRCVAALEGLDGACNLLAKYQKLYPTCIEFVLLAARILENQLEDRGLVVFKEALHSWPKEMPGIQCIWNQYADYALEKRGVRFTEELMTHWFSSVWKAQDPCNIVETVWQDQQIGIPEVEENAPSCSHCYPKDELFGLLNFSLYRLLQKNYTEARLTIDKALKLSSANDFKHCVKEHASFLFSDGSYSLKNANDGGLLSLLRSYLADIRYVTMHEPLSRRFLKSIKKPRTRQLINTLLGPVSLDCSLINSILKLWFGPSLLPGMFIKFKDLVDFVEALMEILPPNYELALSVCKLITGNSDDAGISGAAAMFWASSLLVSSMFQAFPVPSEQKWIEAADVLGILELQSISERYHQQALLVYPFSVLLWKSYFNLSKTTGNLNAIVEAARERGIELN